MDSSSAAGLRLFTSVAKSEGLNVGNQRPYYNPIYRHPLSLSENRYEREANLRRIISCKIPFQGMAAITKGDSWCLEEVFMQHGLACLSSKDGVHPLHIAIQLNQVDCVQVLLNIGIDVNIPNDYGFTPLRVAKTAGLDEIVELLSQHNALENVSVSDEAPSTTVLEVYPEQNYGTKKKSNNYLSKDCYQISRQSKYF
jgi:hypothetical protein